MIDSHIHTHYSHGTSEVFEIVEHSIKNGLTDIGFAEHFHYDFFDDLGLPIVAGRPVDGTPFGQFKLYYKAVQRAREYYKDKINIRLGVEVDYLESKEEEIRHALNIQPFKDDFKEKNPKQKFEFDFIMGSTHFIGLPLKYFSDYRDMGDDWLIDTYFTSVKSCIKSGLFDIVAHPELIKYFIDKEEKNYRNYLEELVDLLVKYNVAVDVNTDYMKDSKTGQIIRERINPGIIMLKLCNDKNVPLVLGSDAHRIEKLANNFKETIEILKNLGINKLHYIKGRKLVGYDI